MKKIRTRIAPSPTGIAHIGTAYMALFNYAFAEKHAGDFIVRIEDTDRQRFVEGAEKVIYDSLRWLQIPYAEGVDIGGPHAPYKQSERLPMYKDAALELIKKEKAYYCFCTPEVLTQMREAQQAKKEISKYDRRCLKLTKEKIAKKLEENERHVIRMKMPEDEIITWDDLVREKVEINTKELDDQVLIKSDGFPTYHLAVVVDDNAMEVTHIIRGEEWISSTPKHILLYRYFNWELPFFAHMPLLRNPDKSKMSKRKNDVSIPSYKEKGYLPEALRNYLCLLGWSHPTGKEIFSLEEFIKEFSIERVQKAGPIFDIVKLGWMNQQYIQALSDNELLKRLMDFSLLAKKTDINLLKKITPLVKTRMITLSEFDELVLPLLTDETYQARNEIEEKTRTELKESLSKISKWEKDEILIVCKKVMQENKVRMPVLYYLLTGKERGLPLPEALELLGQKRTLARLG